MRLAVITQSRDRIGGVEAYLESILPGLARLYEVAFCTASEEVSDRGAIAVPPGVRLLPLDHAAADPMHRLRTWQPDLLFAHGLEDPILESQVLELAPAVIVEHTYHGTCISSAKTMFWPEVRQCERPFGKVCLALYFPRRCGGLNPSTMVRLYRTQAARLRTLKSAAAVVTLSSHMTHELQRNGVSRQRLHVVPPFVDLTGGYAGHGNEGRGVGEVSCRLLYLGRLEPLKGVRRLLAALRPAADGLQRPVRLTIAGDGAERHLLERDAARICAADARISIEFTGWQDDAGRRRLFADTDALVVPSLWPEPFGLVGLEAGAAGIPAVAFATGGIPEWLHDGENGCLAPAGGARPELLADAIVRCAGTPEDLARLGRGARRAAAAWSLDQHLTRLKDVFERVQPAQPVSLAW